MQEQGVWNLERKVMQALENWKNDPERKPLVLRGARQVGKTWLMQEFGHDPLMVLAAYNAGENAVKNNGGVPAYTETRDYVPKVLAAWAVARGLCVTPPELVTDGCVFAVKG